MLITASIVAHHTKPDDLNRLIGCAMRSPIEVLYIVDNSSHDALRGVVAGNPKIRYIHSLNRGYGAGHNIALQLAMEAGAKYHAVLNPDVYWTDDVIAELARFMETDETIGQTMPKVYYPDGRLQYLCKLCPSPMDLLFKRFLPQRFTRKRMKRFQLRFTDYDKIMNVPYLSGCFMFFRISALRKVGLFDERFFMYPEDIDITRRMHARFKTLFYPHVSIVHAHAAASKVNKKMLRIHIVNMIRYFNKWGWFFDAQRRAFNRQLLKELNYE